MTASFFAQKLLGAESLGRRLWRVIKYRDEPLRRPSIQYKNAHITLHMRDREVSMDEVAHAAQRHDRLAVTAKLTTIKYLLDDVIDQVKEAKVASKLDEAWILLEDARQDLVGPEFGVQK